MRTRDQASGSVPKPMPVQEQLHLWQIAVENTERERLGWLDRRRLIQLVQARKFHNSQLELFPLKDVVEEALSEHKKLKTSFCSRWDFITALFLSSQEIDDFLVDQADRYERNLKQFGVRRARILYRRDSLKSLGPILIWVLQRLMGLEAIRRIFSGH